MLPPLGKLVSLPYYVEGTEQSSIHLQPLISDTSK